MASGWKKTKNKKIIAGTIIRLSTAHAPACNRRRVTLGSWSRLLPSCRFSAPPSPLSKKISRGRGELRHQKTRPPANRGPQPPAHLNRPPPPRLARRNIFPGVTDQE